MTYGIYPDRLAEMLKARAGEKYRPSNGTEGDCFFAAWCRNCQRDKAMREGCDIIANTMCHDIEDEQYPQEWQIGADGQPCCTAFVPDGQPLPIPRCTMTQDMFGEAGGRPC